MNKIRNTIFYINDSSSNCALVFSEDFSLIHSLYEGVIDCTIEFTLPTISNEILQKIDEYLKDPSFGIILTVNNNDILKVAAYEFPYMMEKRNLIMLRKPAMELLLYCENKLQVSNFYGFSHFDMTNIQYALEKEDLTNYYADKFKINAFSAKQELGMLFNNAMIDRFKIFTECLHWKRLINKANTQDEIEMICNTMSKSLLNLKII